MNKGVVLFFSCLLLTACKPSQEKAIDLAKTEISHDMKDPASTQFRDISTKQVGEKEDGSVVMLVCGEVNSKNSFGAYSGFSSFVIALTMKSKGLFSTGVEYTVDGKTIDGTPTSSSTLPAINPCK